MPQFRCEENWPRQKQASAGVRLPGYKATAYNSIPQLALPQATQHGHHDMCHVANVAACRSCAVEKAGLA